MHWVKYEHRTEAWLEMGLQKTARTGLLTTSGLLQGDALFNSRRYGIVLRRPELGEGPPSSLIVCHQQEVRIILTPGVYGPAQDHTSVIQQ